MKEETKKVIDYIIKFAAATDLKGGFVIDKRKNRFVGIDVRFDPELDLDDFPSIKEAMRILKK